MARVRSPWHALRPVFLAGAATFAWLTFSSSPASADLLPEPTPVVNEVLVDAPSTDLLDPVADAVPGTDPAAPVTTVVDDAVDAVDQVAAPPVTGLVEATEPATEPVLESVEPVFDPVEPILAPVLAPVVDPVSDLVQALEPVVDLAPEAPARAVVGLLPHVASLPAATDADVDGAPSAHPAPATAPRAQPLEAARPVTPVSLTFAAPAGPLRTGPAAAVEGSGTVPVPPSSPPAPVPASPGSGGAASGGSPGSAAWLSPAPFAFPSLGASSAPEFVFHAPEPVSFDPGSSPD